MSYAILFEQCGPLHPASKRTAREVDRVNVYGVANQHVTEGLGERAHTLSRSPHTLKALRI